MTLISQKYCVIIYPNTQVTSLILLGRSVHLLLYLYTFVNLKLKQFKFNLQKTEVIFKE